MNKLIRFVFAAIVIIAYGTPSFGAVEFRYGGHYHALLHVVNSACNGSVSAVIGEVRISGGEKVKKYDKIDFDELLVLSPGASIAILFEDHSTAAVGPVSETTWVMFKPLAPGK